VTDVGTVNTTGTDYGHMRKENTLKKLERMRKTLSHKEPDRVPISDFFWGSFIERWRKDLELDDDANPYFYYDLDWIVTIPNMDPIIRSFETLEESSEEVVVKTGFGAIMRKKFDAPMPEFMDFETDTIDKLEALRFDDPYDRRRYFEAGDNQIAGVDGNSHISASGFSGLRQYNRMQRVPHKADRPGKQHAVDRHVP